MIELVPASTAAWNGVDGPLPPGVVRVQPLVHGAIAGKVLHRHSDGCRAESPALEANHDFPGDVGIELGILAECGLDAIPSRLGRDVYLVPVHFLNSRGAPLDARDFGEVPDELEVVRRRQSKRSRPARELASCLGFLVYRSEEHTSELQSRQYL